MILMRHGQSEFNLHFTATRRDPGIEDPRLTLEGQRQAEHAAATLCGAGIRRIIASPYTRALQTAAPIAAVLGLPVHVNPTIRERYHFACDIGTPVSRLTAVWPNHDFSHIEEIWWPADTEDTPSVVARATLFTTEMTATDDWRDTLVVSHWAFILTLTGESLENGDWLRFDPLHAAPPAWPKAGDGVLPRPAPR